MSWRSKEPVTKDSWRSSRGRITLWKPSAAQGSDFSHLPGVIRLQLDGGQRGQSGRKAQQLALHRGDAVENDAVGQNQSREGPAHRDQNGQTAIQAKDEGPVLWVEARVRGAGGANITCLHASATDAGNTRAVKKKKPTIYTRMEG